MPATAAVLVEMALCVTLVKSIDDHEASPRKYVDAEGVPVALMADTPSAPKAGAEAPALISGCPLEPADVEAYVVPSPYTTPPAVGVLLPLIVTGMV